MPPADLAVRARQLARTHDEVLAGARPATPPRPLVARSWSRVVGFGLDPDGQNAREPVGRDEVERRRRSTPLSLVVDEIRQTLGAVADASLYLMVVCDADGVILWREGAPVVLGTADRLGFTEGALWTEEVVGTNAVGTALTEAAPVLLFSAEHFEAKQHPWYCTAAPVHDPRDGRLLGVVDVSGPALTLHPAVSALVATAVRLAESRLWWHHQEALERLRRSSEHVVTGIGGPLLVVDDDGWVAHHVGLAARTQIEAPRPGLAVAVPELGLCLPERLDGGWLVRPGAPAARRVRACLRLGAEPVLELDGGPAGPGWRKALSPRHAEILVRLADAGPAGLTARGLSAAVWGDAEHAVTARAEVSRLRRVLGGLVATGPYRLAEGVTLTVVPG